MLMMRALIPASGTPPQPNIRSLDLGMGVLGKTVLMMLFGGAAWGTGNPLPWWAFPAKTRLRKLRPQPARCIECHADSLSCPLTQLYIPGVPGGVQRGFRGPEALQPAVNTKNETNVPELYVKPNTQLHPGLCAGGSSRTNGSRYPPVSARRGIPGWLQPASSTSPWLFYQVSSEVFSKSSSVMSSLLFL